MLHARGPGRRRGGVSGACVMWLTSLAVQGEVGGGQPRMLCSRRSARARPRWRGVGLVSALEGESVATLARWRRRVGVGASSAARQRRFSRLVLGWAL